MQYPSELELLDFFGAEPTRDDAIYRYVVSDSRGVTLEFSFDPLADSAQTVTSCDSTEAVSVCHECLQRLWIEDGVLHGVFGYSNARVTLTLRVTPQIHIRWDAIRTE